MIRRWMHIVPFLLCLSHHVLAQQAPPSPTEQALLSKVQDLDARLKRAEALIERLLAERSPSAAAETSALEKTLLESTSASPLPPKSAEVARSENVTSSPRVALPQELLPNLGLIGAAASFSAGRHFGVFGGSGGSMFQGSVELPLFNAPGGKFAYEFSAGLLRQQSALRLTSNVAQIANLAVLGPGQLTDALRGSGASPFPVLIQSTSDLSLLSVSPFTLKYRLHSLDRFRLRPYAMVGFGTYVTITSQQSRSGLRRDANLTAEQNALLASLFGNGAPLGGSLIGGQLAAAAELSALGVPSGQGGIDLGILAGAGIDWRIRPRFSLGLDYRIHRFGGFQYSTLSPRGVFHF
jgi:hypothetical protein